MEVLTATLFSGIRIFYNEDITMNSAGVKLGGLRTREKLKTFADRSLIIAPLPDT
jgi:hypothetical protein